MAAVIDARFTPRIESSLRALGSAIDIFLRCFDILKKGLGRVYWAKSSPSKGLITFLPCNHSRHFFWDLFFPAMTKFLSPDPILGEGKICIDRKNTPLNSSH